MADEPMGIGKAGLNILTLQPRIATKDRLRCIAGSQHAKDMFNGESPTSDNRLPAENILVHRYALEKELLIHGSASHARMIAHLRIEENLLMNSG